MTEQSAARSSDPGSHRGDEPFKIEIDERSGFPVISYGRPISSEDVAAILEDD